MARASQDKPYVSLFQGLITEATGLTYPDNSVQDIDNCEINVDGSVQRRLGLVRERNGELLFSSNVARTGTISSHIWTGVGGVAGREFVVVQQGFFLRIYRRDVETISTSLIDGQVDVPTFDLRAGTNPPINSELNFVDAPPAGTSPLFSASGGGRLYMTAPWCLPFYIEFDSQSSEFSIVTIQDLFSTFQYGGSRRITANIGYGGAIRDFNILKGLPVSVNNNQIRFSQLYNLLNAGWPFLYIQQYRDAIGLFPSQKQQWILGKDENDQFSPAVLVKQDFGDTNAPRGKFFLSAITGERTLGMNPPSGLIPPNPVPGTINNLTYDIVVDVENLYKANVLQPVGTVISGASVFLEIRDQKNRSTTSFTCVEFFAGRVFFAGNVCESRQGGVYFSQTLIEDQGKVASFFQEGDPTSETFSDLIDTDGGVVYVQGADGINGLRAYQTGLIVYAENGVWFLRGSDSGFKATDYSVDKLSSIGCISANSIVKLEDTYLFFGENSIYASGIDPINPRVEDIAEKKILRYYNSIPLACRRLARGVYEKSEKKAYWIYSTDVDAPDVFDTVLIFDARTGAFTKYSFFKDPIKSVFVADLFPSVLLSFGTSAGNDVVVNGDPVVVNGEEVSVGVIEAVSQASSDQRLKFLVRTTTTDPTLNNVYFGELANRGFMDYKDLATGSGEKDFSSFFLTAPETLGDLQRYKGTTYIHSFFKKTETVFGDVGGNIVALNESGCLLTGFWDWNKTVAGNRISESQQAYRLRKKINALVGAPVDTGEDIVYTKLKVRGKGRSLALKYESQSGKDFIFLGHSNAFTANEV